MPLHDYMCRHCNTFVRDQTLAPVCQCGVVMEVSYLEWRTIKIQSRIIDNHLFNNGHGAWDEGLGTWVTSRKHREQVMASKGLREVDPTEKDRFMKEWEPAPLTEIFIADRLEETEAKLKSGDLKIEEPAPEVQERIDKRRSKISGADETKADSG